MFWLIYVSGRGHTGLGSLASALKCAYIQSLSGDSASLNRGTPVWGAYDAVYTSGKSANQPFGLVGIMNS
jgi:hypothetical protein